MGNVRWAKRKYTDDEIYSILDPLVREWFKRKFNSFTPPQRYAIVEIHKGENVLISSPTGSGKTLSAFLAIISELISLGRKGKLEDKIYCVYISPLRALNNDIRRNLEEPLREIKELAQELGEEIPEIRIAVRTSDTSSYEKSKMVKKPPHILITTPESLAIALNAPKFRERLRDVRWVIVDEVHALAENKRGSHLALTLERLRELVGRDFVRIGLSATIHPLEEVAKFVFGFNDDGTPRSGLIVDVSFAKQTEIKVESVVEDLIYTDAETLSNALYNRLAELIRKHKTTLIFTNTRSGAERVAFNLKKRFPEFKGLIETHHSSLSREVRLDVEEKLKRGELRAVVCVSGDSKVLTEKGPVEIRHLNSGMIVGINGFKSRFVKFQELHQVKYQEYGVKIRTQLGFEVKCTREHRFLTIDKNGELRWVEAWRLKEGDYVGIIRKLPSPNSKVLILDFLPESTYLWLNKEFLKKLKVSIKEKFGSIKNYAKERGFNSSYLVKQLNGLSPFRWGRLRVILNDVSIEISRDDIERITSRRGKYSLPPELTPGIARLLGFWMASGSLNRNTLIFYSQDKKILERYEDLCKREFRVKGRIKAQDKGTYILEIPSSLLSFVFKNLARPKLEVPPIIYILPEKHKEEFLAGYFDGNGFIKIENGRIHSLGFFAFNRKFAEGIRDILLQLGILSSINEQTFEVSIIEGEKFLKIVNSWRSNYYKEWEDVIPNLEKRLKEIEEKLGYPGTYNRREIRRSELKAIIKLYEKVARERGLNDVLKELSYLKELSEGDIFFDRITSIEPVYLDVAYGIINSETGNYVVNGFVSKNSSTSLELGIDIGTIDLVVLVGSPKSVNRALQRIGRAGHRLHEVSRGIILALDRDDLVEVTVLAHNARNRKLDRIKIPKNPLDVLVQHILGMALEKVWEIEEAYRVVRRAYPYHELPFSDFMNVLKYLAGEYSGLEEKRVYAKIWLENGKFGRRGKMTRAIYYMNTGTIPDEAKIDVFTLDKKYIGTVEEEFAERLMPGDIFVLAGRTYEFVKSRGNKIYVIPREGAKPTIPSWFSEMLPLSFDLAIDIQRFRGEVKKLLTSKRAESLLMKKYGIDNVTAKAIISYFREQAKYSIIPDDETVLVEIVREGNVTKYFFHTLIGRRANDALSRAFAYMISKKKKCNVGIAITDNGFMLKVPVDKELKEGEILELFYVENLREILKRALDNTELLKRRFRHVANRGLLILRRYMGREKSLSRQQMNAQTLLNFLKKNHPNFPLLKEVYREIMEDKMDIENAELFLKWIKEGKIKVTVREHPYPSPFAFNLEVIGASDVVLMEDRRELIKELHKKIMAIIKGVPSPTAPRSPITGV
ncbi:DEAD/DEAH box helicase [Pyrococcus horikoshii]|uniref:DEAD/DEAH box helicase n=2 Tax=Pyrococcus horikoshii TaxID=53953 RepID=A0A832W8I3_PYRHR|nr:DEAD/DEAH box helicase [Pyrococcus horikoshii]HII61848.1 DEAD/DEAH box helicase [Pyrococcus horikoshii]